MWTGEETPTGNLRWFYFKGSDRPLLEQEWKVVAIDNTVTYQWRVVPSVISGDEVGHKADGCL